MIPDHCRYNYGLAAPVDNRDGSTRRNGDKSIAVFSPYTHMSTDDKTRIRVARQTLKILREHKRADDTDNDVVRRLALAQEPESARQKYLERIGVKNREYSRD